MKFELIQLPYAPNALEPAISAETLSFHHGKHLAGYVNTLNSLIEGTELADASLEEIIRKSEGPISRLRKTENSSSLRKLTGAIL